MPFDPDRAAEGVAVLSKFFVPEASIDETLTRVAELARDACGADMAGLTLVIDGRPGTAGFTDPEAPEIDEAQYEHDSGPCLEAYRRNRVVHISETAEDGRWPAFAARAKTHGIRATLSLPVVDNENPIAALNLYARAPGILDDDTAVGLGPFVAQAAAVLKNSYAYWGARDLTDNLQQALASRSTIDYAIGILIAPGGRTPTQAFELLTRASQRENRKLREVAAELVERTVQRRPPGPSRPPGGRPRPSA